MAPLTCFSEVRYQYQIGTGKGYIHKNLRHILNHIPMELLMIMWETLTLKVVRLCHIPGRYMYFEVWFVTKSVKYYQKILLTLDSFLRIIHTIW